MSTAIRVLRGQFGRVALLNMDKPLVEHAHHHCHVLIKASGDDTGFLVGGQSRRLTDDTAVLINTWEPHSYAHRDGAPQTIILALYIEPRWLMGADGKLFGPPCPTFFANGQAVVTPRARHLVDLLRDLIIGLTEVDAVELETLLFSLIVEIVIGNGTADRPTFPLVGDYRIRRAIGFLRENLGSRLVIDEVAREAGLSRPHFFTLFRRCTGLSPCMFVNVLRMEEAIRRLSTGRQLVAELSYDLGFDAQSNFTRFFRQHQGVAPLDFRKAVDLVEAERPERILAGV